MNRLKPGLARVVVKRCQVRKILEAERLVVSQEFAHLPQIHGTNAHGELSAKHLYVFHSFRIEFPKLLHDGMTFSFSAHQIGFPVPTAKRVNSSFTEGFPGART